MIVATRSDICKKVSSCRKLQKDVSVSNYSNVKFDTLNTHSQFSFTRTSQTLLIFGWDKQLGVGENTARDSDLRAIKISVC